MVQTTTLPQSTATVTTTLRSLILVDSCGANPYDDLPDSNAIQQCIDRAASGDTVLFTSAGEAGYEGYMVDKTLFLVSSSPPVGSDLTFASTNPGRPALLQATADLKGFVMRLFANPQIFSAGRIDNVVLSNLRIDGGSDRRVANGPDGIADGVDDNYGSWLNAECLRSAEWCYPGGVMLNGAEDWSDASQNYNANPDSWSVGIVVEGLIIQNVEVRTALGFSGAAGAVRNSIFDRAGDHVHEPGCVSSDQTDEDSDWADGITFSGPDQLVSGNIVFDASDAGIAFFGGENTVISNNFIVARSGNHGMFAGIAIHPWLFGDVSGVQIIGNRVGNEGSSDCGGIHTGIDIGAQMWGGGCIRTANPSAVGKSESCAADPPQPNGALCTGGRLCQVWAYVSAGSSLILRDNFVKGAQVNYLVEGLDLAGSFIAENNISEAPMDTDWRHSARCTLGGVTDSWGTYDFVAHSPSLPGWTDIRIHCER